MYKLSTLGTNIFIPIGISILIVGVQLLVFSGLKVIGAQLSDN